MLSTVADPELSPAELTDSSWSTSFSSSHPSNVFTLDKINQRYRAKCCQIKKLMKALVFENGALCDEVAQVQERILIAKEERRFLVKKLLFYQGYSDASPSQQEVKPKKKPPVKKKTSKDIIEETLKPRSSANNTKRKKPSQTSLIEKKIYYPLPLDSLGRPVFPILLNDLTIHSLGEVIWERGEFHNEDYIFPAGFCSTRLYASRKNIFQPCLYTCTIQDGGAEPRFEIVGEDDPDCSYVGNTADACVSSLFHGITQSCGQAIIRVDQVPGLGALFFGFGVASVHQLIQSSPGARRCSRYKPQRFEVAKTSMPPETSPALNIEALQAQILAQIKEEKSFDQDFPLL